MEAHLQALENRLDAQTLASTQMFEALMQMMQSLKDNMAEARTPRSEDQFNQPKLGYIPKLEFLKFDGSYPRLWIKKCCKYCTLCKSPDEQKVDLASLNMIAKAENWVSGNLSTRSTVDWNDFVIDINGRFKDEVGVNVVEEFNKLQQIDEFENLKAIMLQNSYALPEKYLLESFVGGLKPRINHLLEPLNLKMNHKCQYKEPQLFTVEIPGLDEIDVAVVQLEELDEDITYDPCISLNALIGSQNFHTMRVKPLAKGAPLYTLIDSGSTHNFLDIHLVEKLGCVTEHIQGQSILVADGNHLLCQSVCRNFTWSLGGHEFMTDVIPTCLMQVFELEAEPDEFKALKKTFANVFDESTDLPPSRGVFDHRIPLEPRRGAVKIMPYRYPLKAKGCNRAVGP
uniref:Uncharacterized protein n=1 Tax=Chenopodium quinoa TaxID=63459 RepID=A0A803MHB5_CHEQI